LASRPDSSSSGTSCFLMFMVLTDRPACAGSGLSVYTKFCTPSCHSGTDGRSARRLHRQPDWQLRKDAFGEVCEMDPGVRQRQRQGHFDGCDGRQKRGIRPKFVPKPKMGGSENRKTHVNQGLTWVQIGRRDWTRTNDPHHVKVGKHCPKRYTYIYKSITYAFATSKDMS
jgi:hypothetical protein